MRDTRGRLRPSLKRNRVKQGFRALPLLLFKLDARAYVQAERGM